MSLPINKKQFEGSLARFIEKYERLPYLTEDDVEVEFKNKKKEIELRPYRASRYIREFYGDIDKMSEELLDGNTITYKMIADILNLTTTVVRNAITKETANPQPEVRRGIHMFFGKDYYPELEQHATKCSNCTRRCKHEYWVDMLFCPDYKEKK